MSAPPNDAALRGLRDAQIDALWLEGDGAVLGELYRRYHERLEAVAYRVLGDRAEAQDVAQRVFLALPHAAYRGTSSLWSYLYRAAVNGAVNVLRSRRRREAVGGAAVRGLAIGPEADPAQGPESRVLEGEILAAVAQALQHVKPQHRRALVLRIIWDLSNTEIAAREGVPLATVGTWLRRGREELRGALQPLLRDLGPGGTS